MSNSAILCVDDEYIILMSLREQLNRNFGDHFRYEMAESAAEAWEVIEELYLDGLRVLIIVSDWLMPGMYGDEFLIQVHERFPDIVTVMLTGHADEDAIERARQHANLYACLSKPWSEENLIAVIRAGLNNEVD
jgi:CheY-like chemotaxis protein